jgi:hypothetical protein
MAGSRLVLIFCRGWIAQEMMHPASGCISRCKKRTKLDKTRYFWSKLDTFGLGGTEVRCKLNKTRLRGEKIVRRSRLRSIYSLRKFSMYVSLFIVFVRLISPLPSGITCLSNLRYVLGFEAKLGNSSWSERWADGGWDHWGRSLSDLISAWITVRSSQSMNCHFLLLYSRKPQKRLE